MCAACADKIRLERSRRDRTGAEDSKRGAEGRGGACSALSAVPAGKPRSITTGRSPASTVRRAGASRAEPSRAERRGSVQCGCAQTARCARSRAVIGADRDSGATAARFGGALQHARQHVHQLVQRVAPELDGDQMHAAAGRARRRRRSLVRPRRDVVRARARGGERGEAVDAAAERFGRAEEDPQEMALRGRERRATHGAGITAAAAD